MMPAEDQYWPFPSICRVHLVEKDARLTDVERIQNCFSKYLTASFLTGRRQNT